MSARSAHVVYVPCSLAAANLFVAEHHRHSDPATGHKFSIAVLKDGSLVGVAIIGRPLARMLDDGTRLEILRVCTDGSSNICSGLYSRAAKAAFAMGYQEIVTYTRADETGSSLKASGFSHVGETKAGSWSRKQRPRKHQEQIDKIRWSRTCDRNGGIAEIQILKAMKPAKLEHPSLF